MLTFIAKLESTLEKALSSVFKKGQLAFIFWFAIIFLGTLSVLAAFGFLPSELQENSNGNNFIEEGTRAIDATLGAKDGAETTPIDNSEFPAAIHPAAGSENQPPATPAAGTGYGILPEYLVIPSIGVNAKVDNPTSTSTSDLDYELTKGPVRYPGSGTVGAGNMFIFGHSTGWKVVINKAYRVFNDIKTLNKGDIIYITSGGKNYQYAVRQVTEVNKNDTLITFDTSVNMLTLSTCDSFGAKTDRYVVTADYVGVQG